MCCKFTVLQAVSQRQPMFRRHPGGGLRAKKSGYAQSPRGLNFGADHYAASQPRPPLLLLSLKTRSKREIPEPLAAVVGVITNNSKQTRNTGTPRRRCWCCHQQPEVNVIYRNSSPPLLVLSPTTRSNREIPESLATAVGVIINNSKQTFDTGKKGSVSV